MRTGAAHLGGTFDTSVECPGGGTFFTRGEHLALVQSVRGDTWH